MSSLTAIFGNSEDKSRNSDKLMDLYWNRAELKKEFAAMRKEQYRLKKRVKEEEGRTARVQQKLDHLENLLADPDWAHNVVVHFRLRSIASRCEKKIARFAEELKQQRERRTQSTALVGWHERRNAEVAAIKSRIAEKRNRIRVLEGQLRAQQNRLTSMNAWIRLFKGRSAMHVVDHLAQLVEAAVADESELCAALTATENSKPPDHQGLDIDTKRSINLMILSFAQQLYMHFDDWDLAGLIKEAADKSVGAVNHGTSDECSSLLQKCRESSGSLEKASAFADTLQKRAKMLGETAAYAEKDSAVPVPGSVARLISFDQNGLVRESELDLLGRNFWGISGILSR